MNDEPTPALFCATHNACREGREWAAQFSTMSEVWNACENAQWLLWIIQRTKPIDKPQAVTLAIAFAERSAKHNTDPRVMAAIDAAKAWLANPCDETARAADAAAYAADAAERKAQCDIIRATIPNPFLT
jgi:hypothetical protein